MRAHVWIPPGLGSGLIDLELDFDLDLDPDTLNLTKPDAGSGLRT